MTFLPADYEAPKVSGGYMKLIDGESRFRILSAPVIGWEDWKEKKPVRFKMDEKPTKSIDESKPIRHFWAMIVYNYTEQKIQILQISQATIRKSLLALIKDADWSLPYYYDIKITRNGEGTDTEYHVNPVPHKPIDPTIIEMFHKTPINLEAMFTCEDPFAAWSTYTPCAIGDLVVEQGKIDEVLVVEQGTKKKPTITQLEDLEAILKGHGEYIDEVKQKLVKLGVYAFEDMTIELYNIIMQSAKERLKDVA